MMQEQLLTELSSLLGELEMTDGGQRPADFDVRACDNFDSMALSLFVCAIEDNYNISLTLAELSEAGTRLSNVVGLILGKLGQAPAPLPA